MKKALFAAAVLGATALVGTASAAPNGYGRYDNGGSYNINQRQEQIQFRIEQGARNGALTRHETLSLVKEFNNIRAVEASYRRNGLNRWERADLDRRLDSLSNRVRYERHDRQDRDRRYSDNRGHDRDHDRDGWRR